MVDHVNLYAVSPKSLTGKPRNFIFLEAKVILFFALQISLSTIISRMRAAS